MTRAALLGFLLVSPAAAAQLTTAERSRFTATSSHADVIAFLDSLERLSAGIRVGRLATSPQGRALPYVVASRPLVDGPSEAHRSGKPVIYIQGNIHGGEIEGKEAAQMLLRDLTLGSLRPLLDSVVLIVVPIYNADGNDAFGPTERNRGSQNGPPIVGLRANGQGLDLNRDYIKLEAPETRGAAALLERWDPDLFLDLHTTNGSRHGYVLTYAPGLNPNTSAANDYIQDQFLPEVRTRMRSRHRQEIFPYGNFRNADSLVFGWETYDSRPRFGVNWQPLRGRMAILSEAYSHAPFEVRVSATYNFVLEVLRLAAAERSTIKSLVLGATRRRPDSVTVRSVLAPPREMEVVAELTERVEPTQGGGPFARRRPTGVFRTIRMPVYDRFASARKEAIPAAYLLPPQHQAIADLLRTQGVEVRRVMSAWQGPGEAFRVDSLSVQQLFEGHRTISVEGAWRSRDVSLTPGWFLISTDQRLGTFAAYLLEPASEDGLVTWNFLDRDLRRGQDAPVLRVRRPLNIPTALLPLP